MNASAVCFLQRANSKKMGLLHSEMIQKTKSNQDLRLSNTTISSGLLGAPPQYLVGIFDKNRPETST